MGLKGAFNTLLADVVPIEKEDLDMPNHLSGKKRKLLKLLFSNVSDLCQLRDVIKQAVAKNQVCPVCLGSGPVGSACGQLSIHK